LYPVPTAIYSLSLHDALPIFGRLGVLVGPQCELSIEQVHADLAILGGTGVTEAGVWNHNALIIAAQRKMIAASERAIFARSACTDRKSTRLNSSHSQISYAVF